MTTTTRSRAFGDKVLGVFVASAVVGMVGLGVMAFLGFEEPNTPLFLVSTLLVMTVPVAVLVHLIATRELTREEKGTWIRELASRRSPWAFSDYLASDDRRAVARRLKERRAAQG